MRNDITPHRQKIKLDSKEYTIEFDYFSLSEVEEQTKKGVYQLYDMITQNNSITLNDSLKLLCCGLMKHHDKNEIEDIQLRFKESPGLWVLFKQPVIAAFIFPLMPPEIVQKITSKPNSSSKKKVK